MANRKSPAAQAIRDMLEMGFDITFFTGNVNRIHGMNAEISIITKERTVKKVVRNNHVHTSVKIQTKISVYHRPFIINPDGTIALESHWDFD